MKKLSLLLTLTLSSSFALNIGEAVEKALEENFTLKEQQEFIQETKETISSKKSSFLPIIDISHTYGKKNETASFQLKKESTSTATLSYNLFNGFANYQDLKSAEYLSSASEFMLKAKKEDIALQVKQTYTNYLKNLYQKQSLYASS